MKRSIYTKSGIAASILWPCAIAFVLTMRERLGGVRPLEVFLREHPFYDIAFICGGIISFILSPVLLILGLFRTKKEGGAVWMPFTVAILAYAVGFGSLLIYLKAVTPAPFLVIFIYLVVYTVALLMWRRRPPNPESCVHPKW